MADQIGLFVIAVAHVRHVADVDHGVAHALDGHVFQQLDFVRAVVHGQNVFAVADLCGTRRQIDVLPIQRAVHVERGQSFTLQSCRIKIDHDQPWPSSVGQGHCRALHRRKLIAHQESAIIVQFRLRHRAAAQRDLHDRHARCVVLHDLRRRGAGRHAPRDGLRGGGDLRHRLVDMHGRMKINADDVLAVNRVRLDTAPVAHRR